MRIILAFILLCFLYSYSSGQEKLSFSETVKIEGSKSKKIYKDLSTWFNGQTRFRSLQEESNQGLITGKGYINYRNPVQYEGSKTFSRVYAEKTNGIIVYQVKLYILDFEYTYEFSNFEHVPNDKVDNINFGTITDNEKIPDNVICEVEGDWCQNVWTDIKEQIKKNVEEIALTIPFNTGK